MAIQSDLQKALIELGLSSAEQDVFMASLKGGPMPVTKLARQVGLERPYVYTVIKSLRELGLASPDDKRYSRTFTVEPPSVVLDLLKKRRGEVEILHKSLSSEMPKYLGMYKGQGVTQVFLYEGKKRFLELYDRIFEEEPEETLYFGDLDHFISVVEESGAQTWIRKRIQKKIKMRFLPIESPRVKEYPTDPSQFRATRVIPKELAQDILATFQVFGNTVIFWQPETPAAVVLRDKRIAGMHREIFNLLWRLGKPV